MKKVHVLLILISIAASALLSCEDVVKVDVPQNEEKLVIDAQLHNGGGNQSMKVMVSQPYFNNSPIPPATGAIIQVSDNEGNKYNFVQQLDKDSKPSLYFMWKPVNSETFGKIGNIYTLEIKYKGETYKSIAEMKPVPKIDSLTFAFKDNSALPSSDTKVEKIGYRSEFFARDLTGPGDCYLIKGSRYNKKENKWDAEDKLQIAYDAAFQPGARADGLVFILPIRRSISNKLLQEGDSIRTSLYSISESHFDFLRAAGQESANQGLFATPPQTFQTNILNANPNSSKKALGWFSASGLSKIQVYIDPKKASKDTD